MHDCIVHHTLIPTTYVFTARHELLFAFYYGAIIHAIMEELLHVTIGLSSLYTHGECMFSIALVTLCTTKKHFRATRCTLIVLYGHCIHTHLHRVFSQMVAILYRALPLFILLLARSYYIVTDSLRVSHTKLEQYYSELIHAQNMYATRPINP